jgi:hypothetical protein
MYQGRYIGGVPDTSAPTSRLSFPDAGLAG